ncbi:hypothetical protein KIN20_019726 [Parelaphostrongylus tenuis]|uniref:Uncharacterized protein n=1 Tax=Parelaphostrongylus tenuis TaxID=148309 RepID=A0AAD5N5S7_PARTN|nr:hypothetical protein KIN20_019726 [Parelaphostrongylus tenuis]
MQRVTFMSGSDQQRMIRALYGQVYIKIHQSAHATNGFALHQSEGVSPVMMPLVSSCSSPQSFA